MIQVQLSAQNLIPQPASMQLKEGHFRLTLQTIILSERTDSLDRYLNEHVAHLLGKPLQITVGKTADKSHSINFHTDRHIVPEGYKLRITPQEIHLTARDHAGMFYALQTLFQLMPPEVYRNDCEAVAVVELPCVEIEDAPRFAYRGAMLDVSRTFFNTAQVKQYLDWMSRHKLNRFHWHLTDDNGWRIEIKKYPELTDKGAWRGPGEVLAPAYGSGEQRYGGFYTQDEIREVVRYAAFRGIEIIPEIDLPGHVQAVTAVYPEMFCLSKSQSLSVTDEMRNVLCPTREENYAFLEDVMAEVAALFPSRYIHIGGDEVNYAYWRSCTRCQAYLKEQGLKKAESLQPIFVKRLEDIVHDLGKEAAGWNEIIKGERPRSSTLIYGWQNLKVCEEALNMGLPTLVMPAGYTYIDMRQHPQDRGHTWANLVDCRRVYSLEPNDLKIDDSKRHLIRGVEACLFAELLDRPERYAEYQSYPRLCALSEVGWTAPELRNWEEFYGRLCSSHLDRLSAMGIGFRMFPAEVRYQDGVITAISPIADAEIRYTTDLSEPTQEDTLYTQPIEDQRSENYLFRTFYKGGYSSAVTPTQRIEVMLEANEKRSLTIPLQRHIDREGIWQLTFMPDEENTLINTMGVTGSDTTYTIIRSGQRMNPFGTIRLYIDERNRAADLNLTLSNTTAKPNCVRIDLRPSNYLEPPVSTSSSLTATRNFSFNNLTDYNMISYSRTTEPCRAGDQLTYRFEFPVRCRAIEVRTGIPNITRYIITQGYVEYSYDGTTFIRGAAFDTQGAAMIRPEKALRAVRIKITGGNGEQLAAFQDLRIIPE